MDKVRINPKEFMAGYRRMVGYDKAQDVADKLGITRVTFVKYEHDPKTMPIGYLAKLEELYGENFTELFFAYKCYK